jgi:hypothetical protein
MYWVECAVTTLLARRTVNKKTETVAKTWWVSGAVNSENRPIYRSMR